MNVPQLRFSQDSGGRVLDQRVHPSTEAARAVRDPLQEYPHPDADLRRIQATFDTGSRLTGPSVEEAAKITGATTGLESSELPNNSFSSSTFLLPIELADHLRVMSKAIQTRIAFAVVRGLNPEKYSEEENAIVNCGIASHTGIQRSATSHGMAIVHIRDATYDAKPKNIAAGEQLAPSMHKGGMRFHADRMYADILSVCRNPSDPPLPTAHVKSQAAIGGERYIHSPWEFMRKLVLQSKVLPVFRGDPQWAETRQPSTVQKDHHPGQHKGPRAFVVQTQLWPNDPPHQRIPARSCLGSLGQNVALVSTLIASSYSISRYRLQETTPKHGSGGNIFDAAAAWGPSPLQFYCSCGIWTVAVVLWFHKHRNSEHQTLVLAVGILSAICVGATLNMSLEEMGRQVMPWCVVVSLLLSAVVGSVLRGLLRIPTLENCEDVPDVQL